MILGRTLDDRLASRKIHSEEKTMIHSIAVFTFLLIVGVCSYVLLDPGSYSTPVLCLAAFVMCVAILAVAPVWKLVFNYDSLLAGRRLFQSELRLLRSLPQVIGHAA
jgi:hypothetical protein